MSDIIYCPEHGVKASWCLAEPHEGSTGSETAPPDMVNHPPHYTGLPCGVEVIEITEHMTFSHGSAVKYLLRAGRKGGPEEEIEDFRKAAWYASREADRLEKELPPPPPPPPAPQAVPQWATTVTPAEPAPEYDPYAYNGIPPWAGPKGNPAPRRQPVIERSASAGLRHPLRTIAGWFG